LQEDAGELMKKLQNRILEALELLESSAGGSDGGSSIIIIISSSSSSSSGKASSSSSSGAGGTDGDPISIANIKHGPRLSRQVKPHPSDTGATAQSSKRAAAPVAEDKPSKRARKAAPALASAAALSMALAARRSAV
jgi:hypothetical protein